MTETVILIVICAVCAVICLHDWAKGRHGHSLQIHEPPSNVVVRDDRTPLERAADQVRTGRWGDAA